jgi:anti-sigma-K factor RskA
MLTNEDNQSIGTLVRFTDNHIFLVLDKAAPPSQVYQAWEIVEGQPASLGIWSGRVFETTQALSANSIFGVTLEPPGGSTQPSSTPIILYNL